MAEAALGASIQNITFHRVRDVAPNKVSPSVHDFQFVLLFIFFYIGTRMDNDRSYWTSSCRQCFAWASGCQNRVVKQTSLTLQRVKNSWMVLEFICALLFILVRTNKAKAYRKYNLWRETNCLVFHRKLLWKQLNLSFSLCTSTFLLNLMDDFDWPY